MAQVKMHMRFIFIILFGLMAPAYADTSPETFMSEQAARRHCPKDTIVWLNVTRGVYYLQGERLYGKTQPGGYVCELEATKAGYAGSWTLQ